jgi:hypothetical protein
VSFYVGLEEKFAPKANMECIFFIASPVLSIGVAIVYSLVLCSVTAFWWPGGVAPSDWTLVRFASLRGCLVRSPKQTNKREVVG